MIEGDRLLNSLHILLEKSRGYSGLDQAVDQVANVGRRLNLIGLLFAVESQMDATYRKLFPVAYENAVIIRSRKDPTGRVFLSLESDLEYTQRLIFDGVDFVVQADASGDRCLYYEEFKQRLHILVAHIQSGRIDEFLLFTPKDVIHKIVGLGGELLPLLRIDPLVGNTYQKFVATANVPEPDRSAFFANEEMVKKAFANAQIKLNLDPNINVSKPIGDESDVAEGIPTLPNQGRQLRLRVKNKGKVLKIYKLPKRDEVSKKESDEKTNDKQSQ